MYCNTQDDQIVLGGLQHHVRLNGFGHDFFKLLAVHTQNNISF